MVDSKYGSSFLVIGGFVILGVFVYVSVLNILPNNSSGSYFSRDEVFNIKVNEITYNEGKINVYVDDNKVSVCVKETKSVPKNNSICWKNVNNGYVSFSAFSNRKYYIWLKKDDNISQYIEYKIDN